MKKILHIIAVLEAIAVMTHCQKPIECPVPGVDLFEFDVNFANPAYSVLKTSISAVSVNGFGYRKHGVIIYRHNYEHEMFVYDATCVDNAGCIEQGIVRPDVDNPTMGKCQRCGARYTFTDGIHTQKRIRLRAYNIALINNTSEEWRVSNR